MEFCARIARGGFVLECEISKNMAVEAYFLRFCCIITTIYLI